MGGQDQRPILACMKSGPVQLSGTTGRSSVPGQASWATAIRAGFGAYVATTLVVSLLLGSFWAGQTDFPGHRHPAGSPEHHHSLYQVIGAPAVPAPAVIAENEQTVEYLEPTLWLTRFPRAPVRSSALARAPPSVRRSQGPLGTSRRRSPSLHEPHPPRTRRI